MYKTSYTGPQVAEAVDKVNKLHAIATSGDYNDLENKPSVATLDENGQVLASMLPIGETSTSVYAGDKGKQNAEDIKNLADNKQDKITDTNKLPMSLVDDSECDLVESEDTSDVAEDADEEFLDKVLRKTPQILTDEEKSIVRKNIGITSNDDYLSRITALEKRLDDLGLTVNEEGYLCTTVEVSDENV